MYRRLALQGEYAILRLYASSVGRQNTQNLRQLLTLIAQHMAATKILCVHGIGHAEEDPRWNQPWDDIITDAFKRCNNPEPPQFAVVAYDDLFKDAPLNPAEYFEAVAELLAVPPGTRSRDLPLRGSLARPTLGCMRAVGSRGW